MSGAYNVGKIFVLIFLVWIMGDKDDAIPLAVLRLVALLFVLYLLGVYSEESANAKVSDGGETNGR